jgi:spore maturation protein CgeB
VKIVIFGLTISSSWGNGHATLWRGLCKALIQRGQHVVFYERTVPYYAAMRDLDQVPGGRLELYDDWESIRWRAASDLNDADVAIITSYCPDSLEANRLVLEQSRALRVFYDLDTPVTLARLDAGESVAYIAESGLRDFDLVLSYSGGQALAEFRTRLGARRVAPLYGHVDPDMHHPAQMHADCRFLIGGAQYPAHFPWSPNIYFVRHLPPAEHAAFFCSSRLTLNVTRRAMVERGWCPSGRLFEAAACGTPIVSDAWEGLDAFFRPNEEIIIAAASADVTTALEIDEQELKKMARRARERVLEEHSSRRRADQLLQLLETPVQAEPGLLASAGV